MDKNTKEEDEKQRQLKERARLRQMYAEIRAKKAPVKDEK